MWCRCEYAILILVTSLWCEHCAEVDYEIQYWTGKMLCLLMNLTCPISIAGMWLSRNTLWLTELLYINVLLFFLTKVSKVWEWTNCKVCLNLIVSHFLCYLCRLSLCVATCRVTRSHGHTDSVTNQLGQLPSHLGHTNYNRSCVMFWRSWCGNDGRSPCPLCKLCSDIYIYVHVVFNL